jgi:hypothetical protein
MSHGSAMGTTQASSSAPRVFLIDESVDVPRRFGIDIGQYFLRAISMRVNKPENQDQGDL